MDDKQCDNCGECGGDDGCVECGSLYRDCNPKCGTDQDFDSITNQCCSVKDFDCMGICNGTGRLTVTVDNVPICCEVK